MYESMSRHVNHVLKRTKRYMNRCERLGLDLNNAPGHIKEKFSLIETIAKTKQGDVTNAPQ